MKFRNKDFMWFLTKNIQLRRRNENLWLNLLYYYSNLLSYLTNALIACAHICSVIVNAVLCLNYLNHNYSIVSINNKKMLICVVQLCDNYGKSWIKVELIFFDHFRQTIQQPNFKQLTYHTKVSHCIFCLINCIIWAILC